MKKILAILLASAIILSPSINAQTRPGTSPNQPSTTRPGQQSNTPGRPGSNTPSRPDASPNRPSTTRPGQQSNTPSRPGSNTPSRPGSNTPSRPGSNQSNTVQRPYRPGVAPSQPLTRPTPPAGTRPSSRTLWSNILGINLGMTLRISLDQLTRGGYNIDGYDSNQLHLTNITSHGFNWPQATMYYDADGQFIGSRFYYSTLGYDNTRYNTLLRTLTNQFGAPVTLTNNTNGMSATWYGNANQYVTLQFSPLMTDSGRRYFTTLTFGS